MEGLFRRTLSEAIDLRFMRGKDLWTCEADPHQLESALLNLVINARDAMPEGGQITIETNNISVETEGNEESTELTKGEYVRLSVSDNGHGMTQEVLTQVFEPFFTTKPPGKGTGLGLSMVYGFLKQSGGQVKIDSEPGAGTKVKLYLPRAKGPVSTNTVEEPIKAPPRGSETVLVVEDDDLVRQHVVSLLSSLGYAIIPKANGPEALIALQQHPEIALLFTDVIIPGGMNGRQLAKIAIDHKPNLRVLYTSGYTEHVIAHQGRLDPGVALLGKPYTRQDLARKIRDVLDQTH